MFAPEPEDFFPEDCQPPFMLTESAGEDALAAVHLWIETEAAPGWDVVKNHNLIVPQVELTQAEAKRSDQFDTRPDRIDVNVKLVYDGEFGFFGEVVAAKAWRDYKVTISRDCAGGEWHVEGKLVDSGGVNGPPAKGGPVGVPSDQAS